MRMLLITKILFIGCFVFSFSTQGKAHPLESVTRPPLTLSSEVFGFDGVLEISRDRRLVLRSGDRIVQTLLLEKADAAVEVAEIEPGKKVVLITEDFTADFGSYNGPITRILEFTANSMRWASARSKDGRKRFEISLMRSLKSAWSFSVSLGQKDILQVRCRPGSSGKIFTTTYTRYHYGKKGWVVSERSEKGMWEAEDGVGRALPDPRLFPL